MSHPQQPDARCVTAPCAVAPRGWIARLLLLVLACALIGGATVRAQDAELEYKVKSAFLFNFLKFTEFPTNRYLAPDDAFVIGCLPDDPAAPILATSIEGKAIDNRPIRLVRFKAGDDVRNCHLLFISRTLKARGEEALEWLKKAPVLTVGETDQFAENGGMINFVRHERTFRFEINLGTAERAGLRISSKLATMATIVKSPPPK